MAHIRESEDVRRFNQMKTAARKARQPFEIDWWLNIAFVYDEQYTEWSSKIENVRQIPYKQGQDPLETPRPVANKMAHFAEAQHAFVMQQKPVPDVQPANDDIISMSDSQVALGYAQWAAEAGVSNFPQELEEAVWWAVVCGPSFMKWTWDAENKKPCMEAVSPFDLYLDPFATKWGHVRWAIHSRWMDKDAIYDRYGKEIQGKAERLDKDRNALLMNMGLAPVSEGYTVNEIWMKPDRKREGGLFAAWCGQEELHPKIPMPYKELREEKKLPFTPIGVMRGANTPYFHSHMRRMRPQQMELNKTHAQGILMRENFANLKWWVPGSIELKRPINQAPFQVLSGSGETGEKPEILAPPGIPDIGAAGEWIVAEMEDTIGQHKASQGQVQGRLESAKAVEQIQEGDKIRLHTLLNTTAEAIAEGFWMEVALAKQYEKEEKMVTIFSEDGIPQVRAFRAREVDPGIRFKVSMGTGLGYSRVGRTENLFNLWDRGILQDDPARMLTLLDIGSSAMPLNSDARDQRLARSENYEMETGIPVAPNGWDNHVVHIKEHNDYRKTQAFRLLTPRAKTIFEFHVRTHEQLLLRELEKQAQQQLIAGGATFSQEGPPDAEPPDPEASQEGAAGPGQAGAAPPAGETEQEPGVTPRPVA